MGRGGRGDKRQNLEGRGWTWEARFPNICDGAFVKVGIVHLRFPKCNRVPSVEGSSCDRAEGWARAESVVPLILTPPGRKQNGNFWKAVSVGNECYLASTSA